MHPVHTPLRLVNPGFFSHPHWFGGADTPLFGCLDVPRAAATASGVIIVAPLGEEKLTTHRGLRNLAATLARMGHAVLRFDLPGTGSSFGHQRHLDDISPWLDGLSRAVAHMSDLGIERITLVDVRMSAFITETWLSSASPDLTRSVERVVHWLPAKSGKRWLREQKTKFAVTVGSMVDEEAFSALEMHISRDLADTLATLSWKGLRLKPGVSRIMAVSPTSSPDPSVATLRGATDQEITVHESVAFLAPSTLIHHVPYSDIALICDAVGSAADTAGGLHPDSPQLAALALRAHFTSPGGEALEEVIELRAGGRLLSFTTRSADAPTRAAVIFESTANEPAWGPAFLWVEYSRTRAGGGVTFVRHDKDNYGESGVIEPGSIPVLYSAQSKSDAVEVAAEIAAEITTGCKNDGGSPRSHTPLMMVGLCSGAWMSVEAGLKVDADTVVLVNATQWARNRRPVDKAEARRHGFDPETGQLIRNANKKAGNPSSRLTISRFRAWLDARSTSLSLKLSRAIPLRLWEALAALGLGQSPGTALRSLSRRNIATSIILSPVDEQHFRRHRGYETLQRINSRSRGGQVRLETLGVPEGDHSLHRPDSRAEVVAHLDRQLARLRTSLLTGEGKP